MGEKIEPFRSMRQPAPPPPTRPASPGWKPDSERARGVNATAYEADQDFIYSP